MSTLERVRRLLAELLHIEESTITPDSSIAHLFDRHSMDSLDHVEFVMALEEAFDLAVTDQVSAAWETARAGETPFPAGTVQQLVESIHRQHNR